VHKSAKIKKYYFLFFDKRRIMNKKLFCILSLMFLNKANGMEISKQVIEDTIIPSALIVGVGAASGAACAGTINTINKYFGRHERCSIPKSATLGALCSLPLVAATQCGSWPKLKKGDFNKMLMGVAAAETFLKVLWFPGTHFWLSSWLSGQNTNLLNSINNPDTKTYATTHQANTLNNLHEKEANKSPLYISTASIPGIIIASGFALFDRYKAHSQ
jgi:hypothetical protein